MDVQGEVLGGQVKVRAKRVRSRRAAFCGVGVFGGLRG